MQINRLGKILSASLLSTLMSILLAVAVLAGATYSYTVGNGMIYDYLFGPNSSAELIKQSRGAVSVVSNTIFGNPTLNKVLYFGFWMFVGLLAYIMFYTLLRGTSKVAKDIEESTYKNRQPGVALENFGLRLAARVGALIGWSLFWVFFIQTLLPFSVLSARIGISNFPSLSGWLYGGLGLVVLALSIHIHVIFARLVALRFRLFSTMEMAE